MGTNRWSGDDYREREKIRTSTGKSAFTYTDDVMKNVESNEQKVHPLMNPFGINRESRDSATHPESLAIAVNFDVTGSMGEVPRVFQKGLARLMGLLMQMGVEHPQILIGAIGDATCDRAPLQIGQFESGIEIDNDLGRVFIEGRGGGQATESYELAIYFASNHTSIDCFEKRGKKGYLIISGDEMPYSSVKKEEVWELIDDTLEDNIPTEEIIKKAKEKYHIFMLRPTDTQHGRESRIAKKWISLLGEEYVIQMDYPQAVSEMIALIVAVTEGVISLKDGVKTLKEFKETGLNAEIIESVASSLASIPAPKAPAKKSKSSASSSAGKSGKDKDTEEFPTL